MKIKYGMLSLLLVIMSSVLFGCVESYKSSTVEAVVIEKDYDAPKTTTKTVTENGKQVVKKTTKPEEYEVTVEYNGIQKEFDNKSLFNKVEEGQKIKVIYKEGFDEEGNVVAKQIELLN